jgi:hypothetical protein
VLRVIGNYFLAATICYITRKFMGSIINHRIYYPVVA